MLFILSSTVFKEKNPENYKPGADPGFPRGDRQHQG